MIKYLTNYTIFDTIADRFNFIESFGDRLNSLRPHAYYDLPDKYDAFQLWCECSYVCDNMPTPSFYESGLDIWNPDPVYAYEHTNGIVFLRFVLNVDNVKQIDKVRAGMHSYNDSPYAPLSKLVDNLLKTHKY